MCTQDYILYSCGCAQKGEFRQCPERFQTNVRCDPMGRQEKTVANYCPKHLIKAGGDAKVYYTHPS